MAPDTCLFCKEECKKAEDTTFALKHWSINCNHCGQFWISINDMGSFENDVEKNKQASCIAIERKIRKKDGYWLTSDKTEKKGNCNFCNYLFTENNNSLFSNKEKIKLV